MADFPAHIFPDTAEVNGRGHLVIGGCDVVDLAGEFGTPLYVFDEASLRGRARAYRDAFRRLHPDTLAVYASKAFICRALARLFAEEGLGLDVVSGGELFVARSVEFPLDRVYFHGNNKSAEELRLALQWGVGRVVVDNLQEISLLGRLAVDRGLRQPVLVRVTPGVDPHTHRFTTTGVVDSKFGFPIPTGQAEEAVRRVLESPGLEMVGLHFHLGSPIFETEPYTLALGVVLRFARDMRERHGLELRELSPGGGFAIAYTRDQRPPSPEGYASAIVGALRENCDRLGLPLPRLVVEPGRAVAGPSAVALYTVGAVKEVPGIRRYVAVDGGMGDNIRPALYDARYEAFLANRMLEEPAETVTVVGKFCESGDVLVRDALLPPTRPGDLVVIPASGAYNLSMASNYNLNPRPAVVMVGDGRARLIRRREAYEDLVSCDV